MQRSYFVRVVTDHVMQNATHHQWSVGPDELHYGCWYLQWLYQRLGHHYTNVMGTTIPCLACTVKHMKP